MPADSFFTIGQRLTDYASIDVTVARAASGGFGTVAMGPNQAIGGQWSALKMLRPDVLAQARAGGGREAEQRLRALFLREALTWRGLWPHANLLTAHFVTEINGQLMLVLDYADNGSLRDWFAAARRQGGWPTAAAALGLAQHTAAGLLTLHTPTPDLLRDFPIIHRDLKPENILLDQQGFAMITDFGLAKAVADALATTPTGQASDATILNGALLSAEATAPVASGKTYAYQTRAGAALGTPAYMAPEQWLDASHVQEPADAYAFGVILAELFTSRHPLLDFDQPHTLAEWRLAHTSGRPVPLRQLGADLLAAQAAALPTPRARADLGASVERVERLVARLLDKRPDARPTMAETLGELRAAAQTMGKEPYIPPDVYSHTPEGERIFWHGWATAYSNFQLYQQALERIERALAIAPNDPGELTSYGIILAGLGRKEEALGVCRRALALTPADDHRKRMITLNQLGVTLKELGRYAEAEDAFATEVTLAPDAAIAWFNRADNARLWALAEQRAGHLSEARTHADAGLSSIIRSLRLNPDDVDTPQLAQALRQLRDQF